MFAPPARNALAFASKPPATSRHSAFRDAETINDRLDLGLVSDDRSGPQALLQPAFWSLSPGGQGSTDGCNIAQGTPVAP